MPALTELFTNIANSIRTKTGSSEQIPATNFPTAISQIPSGAEIISLPFMSGKKGVLQNDAFITDKPIRVYLDHGITGVGGILGLIISAVSTQGNTATFCYIDGNSARALTTDGTIDRTTGTFTFPIMSSVYGFWMDNVAIIG